MVLDKFIKNFANQFDDTDISEINAKSVFKDLEEWSSLISLGIIAMVDEEYEVRIKGDDIKNSSTIEDLYMIVVSRI